MVKLKIIFFQSSIVFYIFFFHVRLAGKLSFSECVVCHPDVTQKGSEKNVKAQKIFQGRYVVESSLQIAEPALPIKFLSVSQ